MAPSVCLFSAMDVHENALFQGGSDGFIAEPPQTHTTGIDIHRPQEMASPDAAGEQEAEESAGRSA